MLILMKKFKKFTILLILISSFALYSCSKKNIRNESTKLYKGRAYIYNNSSKYKFYFSLKHNESSIKINMFSKFGNDIAKIYYRKNKLILKSSNYKNIFKKDYLKYIMKKLLNMLNERKFKDENSNNIKIRFSNFKKNFPKKWFINYNSFKIILFYYDI